MNMPSGSSREKSKSTAKRLAVITPTYAPDYEIFKDLHRSVMEYTTSDVVQYLIVPRADRGLFSQFAGPRCVVLTYHDVFPRRIIETAWLGSVGHLLLGPSTPRIVALNLRQPYPPIRGWILQQFAKLAIVDVVDADILLLADSDVHIVRPVTLETLLSNGRVPLFRRTEEVDDRLPRHFLWHKTARELLGLPDARPPYPDYVLPFGFWERSAVLSLHEHVQKVTGRHWLDAVTAHVHFSEWVLYGLFLEEVVKSAVTTDSSRCHTHWGYTPLDLEQAKAFVHRLRPDDLAILIHSKSHTPAEIRRAAIASLALEARRP
jgi:hypothetical protein